MRSKKVNTYSFFLNEPLYHCNFYRSKKIYRSTAIVAGMSSLLDVIFVFGLLRLASVGYRLARVASMGFPTFVAHHGCVSSHPNMMIHTALD